MVNETNEDFGLGDRNFHPEEQRINSKTIKNKYSAINQHQIDNSDSVYKSSGEKDLDNYTRNDYDPYQDDLDDDDLHENVDEDLDDNGETSEDDSDKKDTSDL
jgi:hypothetical protein